MSQPIISICIPTYNRSITLNKLFNNLTQIKSTYGEAVEICVSNNQSTDNTLDVIKDWTARLNLKVITQANNIGATMNFIGVTKIATGKWLLIIGDDDLFIKSGFDSMIELLTAGKGNEWVLVGVLDESSGTNLLGDLTHNRYSATNFKQTILRTGLYRYGFVGMHVFPSSWQKKFSELSFDEAQPWPHLALFLRYVQSGTVKVFDSPVVKQAGGGGVLFWKIKDMVHIKLRKLNVIAEARSVTKLNAWFYDLLILRELYLARDIRTLIFWKILDTNNFNKNGLFEYISRYRLLKMPYIFLVVIHFILLMAVYALPKSMIRVLLNLIGQKNSILDYENNEKLLVKYDGIKRGV
jgi:glycosyltransferase involved in cell wall biosynthesis